MELIKKKILLEDSIDRGYNSPTWGQMTATTFYLNVFIKQTIDDMGIFSDVPYLSASTTDNIVDYSVLLDKLYQNGGSFPFMTGATPSNMTGTSENTARVTLRLPSSVESSYYNFGNQAITGSTESKIEEVRSYNESNPYLTGFDIQTEVYTNYNDVVLSGVNRVVTLGEPSIYVFDTVPDTNIGTQNQITGLQYQDYTELYRNINVDGISQSVPVTRFRYIGEGLNKTNTSLSALTKEEYLFGIVSPPEVQNDLQVDRGITTVIEKHLRLSEIKTLGQLSRYGNGYYKIIKQ